MLRRAGFLACGIGLPIAPVAGDMNGLRIGTPELVRRGVTPDHAAELGWLITQGLTGNDPDAVALRTREMRARFEFVLAEPALRSSLSEAFRHFEEVLSRQFVRGGAVGPIEARITAAATMAAMVAAFELWTKAESPQPFSSAARDAAASLRSVLTG